MIKINLNEEKKAVGTQLIEYTKYVNWKLTIFAVLFFKIPGFAVGIYFSNEVRKFNEENQRVQALVKKHSEYIEANRQVKEQVKVFQDKIAELKLKIDQIQKISEKKKNPFYPLESIIHIIPENIWLTEVMVRENFQINIKGVSREYKFINSFKDNLNRSPYFENSFVLDKVETVNKDKKITKAANTLRDEVFAFTGKIVRFEL